MSSMGYIRGFKNDGGYELVLQKNVDTGEWTKPNSAQTEPSVIKTYEVTNSEFAEEYFENDKLVTMVRYYGMSCVPRPRPMAGAQGLGHPTIIHTNIDWKLQVE